MSFRDIVRGGRAGDGWDAALCAALPDYMRPASLPQPPLAARRGRRLGERMRTRPREPRPRDDGWDKAMAPFRAAPLDNEQRQARRESRLLVRNPANLGAAAAPVPDNGWGEALREFGPPARFLSP